MYADHIIIHASRLQEVLGMGGGNPRVWTEENPHYVHILTLSAEPFDNAKEVLDERWYVEARDLYPRGEYVMIDDDGVEWRRPVPHEASL